MAKSKLMLDETAIVFLIGIAITGSIIGWSIYYSISSQKAPRTGPIVSTQKVSIQSLSGNVATSTITVKAQSTGRDPVVLESAIIKDYQGMKLETVNAVDIEDYNPHTAANVPTIYAELTTLVIKVEAGTLGVGERYTITLVTTEGNSFVSQGFKAEAY